MNDEEHLKLIINKLIDKIVTMDKKVQSAIDKKHGKDTLKSIQMIHQYNTGDTTLSKRRHDLFYQLSDYSYKLTKIIGTDATLAYIDNQHKLSSLLVEI